MAHIEGTERLELFFHRAFCGITTLTLMYTGILLLINTGDMYDKSNCDIVPYDVPCVKSEVGLNTIDDLVKVARFAGAICAMPIVNLFFTFSLFPLVNASYDVRHTQIAVFKDSESDELVNMTCEAFVNVHVPDLLVACDLGIFMGWFMLVWWFIACVLYVGDAPEQYESPDQA